MFERPKKGERAILVQLALPEKDTDTALHEFEELACSAQAEIIDVLIGSRTIPDAKYFIGLGKAQELAELVEAHNVELVLVNHELSPSQERNLERLLKCRVVDRSGLILDIFAQRARTFEGKLQVELAQLDHLSTRLIRGWTHLERQKGGIGLRGPGETQLETDRRLLRKRMGYIKQRLEKVRCSREQNRSARRKADVPSISLVGYTNAGKSTLFNVLTGSTCYVANQLFATLDPTLRKIPIPGITSPTLIDTVGFIRDLPHSLVSAFRATLEETEEADLLLHVIDASDPEWPDRMKTVESVLSEIGAEHIPTIYVFNKIDNVPSDAVIEKIDVPMQALVSAKTGEGIPNLLETIAIQLQGGLIEEEIELSPHEAKRRAQLHALHAVIHEEPTEQGGWRLRIRLGQKERQA